MAPKMHAGKKQSRRMKGGMTTGEWGIKVFGGSDSQHAVGNGSNVISMNNPNSVVLAGAAPAPQMKGGDWSFAGMMPGSADEKPADGIFDDLSKLNPFAAPSAEEAAKKAEEEAAAASAPPAAASAAPAMGGKGKRNSATKRRKSHKKKGKSSKKRAHKRR